MVNRHTRMIDEHNNVIDHNIGNGGNVIQLKIMYM